MIEHPEAVTIAGQMAETLVGKEIRSAIRGNTPHKWAFYSRPAEEYAAILGGRTITGADASGSMILVRVGPGHMLVLGGGGERILYHAAEDAVPKKHQLLLCFADDTFLSVKVQGWGSCRLWTPEELGKHRWYANRSLSPTDDGFTREYFAGLFGTLTPGEARSVKYFLISEPGVWGIGNGYLQDILLRARVHPRRRAVELAEPQHQALYDAISETIGRAVSLGGRTDEIDLFGQGGGYERVLSAAAKGELCPSCGSEAIIKDSFLGGAIYTCPACQEAPPRPSERSPRRKGKG